MENRCVLRVDLKVSRFTQGREIQKMGTIEQVNCALLVGTKGAATPALCEKGFQCLLLKKHALA